MATPTTTARVEPTGIKMKEGFPTVYAFARKPGINLWEITTKPPGVTNGEPIDNTTQHNTTWRTRRSRKLIDGTDHTFKFAYDPAVYPELVQLVGQEGAVTEHFPDGSTLDYYGYLSQVEFDELEEGKMPTGTGTIVATNFDPVNRVEQGPVLTSVAGT